MKNAAIFETIVSDIFRAIETETGEAKEFKPETDLILEVIRENLVDALDLPKDHHL